MSGKKTIAERQAEIAALQLDLEREELVPLNRVLKVLEKLPSEELVKALGAELESLSGERKQQVHNLMVVLGNSPGLLQQQADQINARLNPPAADA